MSAEKVVMAATPDEALAFIKAMPRTTSWFVHAKVDGANAVDTERYFPGVFSASIAMTRRQCERLVLDSFRDHHARRGVCLRFTIHVWDGRTKWDAATGERVPKRATKAVWIG